MPHDPPSPDNLLNDLQGDFLDESSQLLDRINQNLLFLDQWVRSLDEQTPSRCDVELMNDMFRAAHSIKGLSAMMGHNEIIQLTHKIENLIDAARAGEVEVTAETVEVMFDALDALTQHIEQVRGASKGECDDRQILWRIGRLLAGASSPQVAPAKADKDWPPITPADADCDPLAGVTDDEEIPTKFLAIFIDEAEQSIDHLTHVLLEAESQPRPELVEKLLVYSHRLKGSAASLGLNRCAKLAHAMEDVLQALRETATSPGSEVIDSLLCGTDALRTFVSGMRYGRRDDEHFPAALRQLRKVCPGAAAATYANPADANLPPLIADDEQGKPVHALGAVGPQASAAASPPQPAAGAILPAANEAHADPDEQAAAAALATAEPGAAKTCSADPNATDTNQIEPSNAGQGNPPPWAEPIVMILPPGVTAVAGRAWFPPGLPLPGLKASLILERLGSLGKVIYSLPAAGELDRLSELKSFVFGLLTPASAQTIGSRLKLGGVAKLELVPIARPAEPQAPPRPSKEKAARAVQDAPASNPADDREFPASETERPACATGPVSSEAAKERIPSNVASEATLQHAASQGASAKPPERKPPAGPTPPPAETLRVDIDRLDQLMSLAGQLAINKARFEQVGKALRGRIGRKRRSALGPMRTMLRQIVEAASRQGELGGVAGEVAQNARRLQTELQCVEQELETLYAARQLAGELHDAVHQLDRIASGIQRTVVETRMVPIGPLFNRFRRVVRDLTRLTGKQFRLEIAGAKTELDKRMIDELSDPLLHLVRNCSDHGIESPRARIRAGKPAEGTISFNAYHRGNSIVIEVKDDGQGIDIERIRAKVLQRGRISQAEADQLPPQQLSPLIWEPGFSTAADVTEISGRGIGLDIVRAKVEELNGTIQLDSQPGRGACFTIRLPLTLAILPCLLAEIEGQAYALPMESVQEIVARRPEELMTVQGRWTTVVRDRVLAVVDLHELFAPGGPQSASAVANAPQHATLVVIGEGGKELGLRVDRLLGETDVVVQSLAQNYRHMAGLAGASILGDGRVSLILDIAALVHAAAAPCTPAHCQGDRS